MHFYGFAAKACAYCGGGFSAVSDRGAALVEGTTAFAHIAHGVVVCGLTSLYSNAVARLHSQGIGGLHAGGTRGDVSASHHGHIAATPDLAAHFLGIAALEVVFGVVHIVLLQGRGYGAQMQIALGLQGGAALACVVYDARHNAHVVAGAG